VRSIETRKDLSETLNGKPSGGVYITTIQKFCENTGLLSDRSNIICISDEAHRTQTSVGAKLKKTEKGVFTIYGFAKYLRDSFPNATYCGFNILLSSFINGTDFGGRKISLFALPLHLRAAHSNIKNREQVENNLQILSLTNHFLGLFICFVLYLSLNIRFGGLNFPFQFQLIVASSFAN